VLFLVQGFVLELQRTVRQLAELEVKILIDRAGKNHFLEGNEIDYLMVIGVEHHLNVGMVEHLLEHSGVAVQGHCLVGIGEVPVVAVGAGRHARGHRFIELRGVEAPLLIGVVLEEFIVQLTAYFAHYYVLRGFNNINLLGY